MLNQSPQQKLKPLQEGIWGGNENKNRDIATVRHSTWSRRRQEDVPMETCPGFSLQPAPSFSCCWPNLTGNQLAREPKKQTQGVGPITNRTARERQGMGLRRITPLQTWNSSQLRLLIQCGQQERYYLWKSNKHSINVVLGGFLEIMEGDGDNYFSSSFIKMEKQALP